METEEDIEVELNDVEPAFLRGQTKMTRELSPIRIVKNPDGSLQRAALHQGQLSKERRELKQAQANNLIDSIPKGDKCVQFLVFYPLHFTLTPSLHYFASSWCIISYSPTLHHHFRFKQTLGRSNA